MAANLYAGEVAIIDSEEGREYVFRPSFFAISQLSPDPKELRKIFDRIQEPTTAALAYAHDVLELCYTGSDDVYAVIGDWQEGVFIPGKCATQCVYELGLKLLVNGMCGRPRAAGGKRVTRFDPALYVGYCVAHLGVGQQEAWGMTMMELQAGLEAKYPQENDEPEISQTQWDYYQQARKKEALKDG